MCFKLCFEGSCPFVINIMIMWVKLMLLDAAELSFFSTLIIKKTFIVIISHNQRAKGGGLLTSSNSEL